MRERAEGEKVVCVSVAVAHLVIKKKITANASNAVRVEAIDKSWAPMALRLGRNK